MLHEDWRLGAEHQKCSHLEALLVGHGQDFRQLQRFTVAEAQRVRCVELVFRHVPLQKPAESTYETSGHAVKCRSAVHDFAKVVRAEQESMYLAQSIAFHSERSGETPLV